MDLSELNQIKEKELASRKKYTLRCFMAAGGVSSNAESVKEDFVFFTTSGSLDGDAAALKVDDYWYLAPVDEAVKKLGKM